ncbi:hypothetical protein QE429_003513 [Bacillus sp. SORGH_AS 510]|uniref:YlzJ-like family protein n=1 Tax=Bacillus sp. SORGH_AS_0510 TaxID=3041771 RepID=UPI00278A283F|nr:YlzJ-like family protein [Bacillus sp. SORGH_AS_0510]MDQ1146686.1 hypothetical protein [Bacillus sp. SORGH_AS_0510]
MILYTMMPHELIFPSDQESNQQQKMITYQGIPLLVEQMDPNNVQVVRILSSDPQHFLDDRVCPGAKISFSVQEGLSALQ